MLFSSLKLGWQWAFRASFPGLLFKHEGTRGGGRLRVDAYRTSGFEAYASKLETHPQRAAATATAAATEVAGMVRGGRHVSSRKQRGRWLQLV